MRKQTRKSPFDIEVKGGVKIDASKVTAANIIAKSGVIHVVDTVLVPE